MSDELPPLPSEIARKEPVVYEPLVTSSTPPDRDEETYDSNMDGLRRAAKDLSDSREAERPIIERKYQFTDGKDAGQDVPMNRTLTLDQAADDLIRIRNAENAVQDQEYNDILAKAVDEARGQQPVEQPRDSDGRFASSEQQFEQPQTEQQQPADGLDPEVRAALSNPKIAAALTAEVSALEAAHRQYADASFQSAQLAAAAVMANTVEFQGLRIQDIPVALSIVARQNPARALEIKQSLHNVESLYNQAMAARQHQAQAEAHKMQTWAAQESQKYDTWAAKPENSQRAQAARANAAAGMQEFYGISQSELRALYNSQPLMHSNVVQQLITDALAHRMAMRSVAQTSPKVPPVTQRPGVANTFSRDSGVEAARAEFLKQPTARSAAKFLSARRASQ